MKAELVSDGWAPISQGGDSYVKPTVATAEAASVSTAPAPLVVPQEDAVEQLRKIGELHKAGILTDEEFQAKKLSYCDACSNCSVTRRLS